MKRFGRTVMLKDDPSLIEQYEAYHAHPWPEVVAGLKRVGVERMYIYRYGRLLFMFMETRDDFGAADLADYTADPRAQEWDTLMRSFQEPLPGAPAGETWVDMKEVYEQK